MLLFPLRPAETEAWVDRAASFEKKRIGTPQLGALDFRLMHVLAMRGDVGCAARLGIPQIWCWSSTC